MFELFLMGGPLFMGMISIVFLIALVVSVKALLLVNKKGDALIVQNQISLIKSIGLLALVIGVLGQFIGLFSAFQAMAQFADGVSPAILAGGLKISSITTIWGLICYSVTLIIALSLTALSKR